MVPSPIRLTMCPPASSSGGSTTWATRRSSLQRGVVTGPQRPGREPDEIGEDQVTSRLAGLPDTRSVSACQTCSAPRLTSRDAASRSSSRSATRAAARGPPTPAADSGSPKSGSPGSARRARRTRSMTPWTVVGPLQPPSGPETVVAEIGRRSISDRRIVPRTIRHPRRKRMWRPRAAITARAGSLTSRLVTKDPVTCGGSIAAG